MTDRSLPSLLRLFADWCVNRGQLKDDWLLQLKSVEAKVKNGVANPAFGLPLETQRRMEETGQSSHTSSS